MTYQEQIKHPKWQRKRLEILDRDNFQCQKCFDDETTLHVHHIKYRKTLKAWEYKDSDLVALCEDCHQQIEVLKKEEKDIDFKKILIYKSNNWLLENKIMFRSYDGTLSMEIYDGKNNYVIGFNFVDDLLGLKEIIDKTLKEWQIGL